MTTDTSIALKGFLLEQQQHGLIMKKFENLKGNGDMREDKIPGAVEFLCQKESHQSVSLVLGSTGTRLTCLRFLSLLLLLLVFFDFFWRGAIEHSSTVSEQRQEQEE